MVRGSRLYEWHKVAGAPHRGMSILAVRLTVFGVFAILTGCSDVAIGPYLLVANGATLRTAVDDQWLDSQLRFLGTMWAGWGVMLIWTCRDLRARGRVFEIPATVLFAAGCGRMASCLIHPGSPALPVFFAALELAVAVVGVFLRRLLIAREHRSERSQVHV